MIKIFILFMGLLFFTITQYNEINSARFDCYAQRKKDVELLSRDVCIDHSDRLHFGNMVDCKGAENRQRMTIPMCTVHTWLAKTDLLSIYGKLTDSYWSLLGIILPTIFMILYLWKPAENILVKRIK